MTERPRGRDEPAADRWLLVDAGDPIYADAVIADLTRIMGASSGLALLRRLYATGRCVAIVRPAATDPPNASVRPSNPRSAAETRKPGAAAADRPGETVARGSAASNSIIAYDPADWPSPAHPGSPASDAMLFALLTEACRYTEGVADPISASAGGSALFDTAEVGHYRSERGDV